jgi:hypothetical protein
VYQGHLKRRSLFRDFEQDAGDEGYKDGGHDRNQHNAHRSRKIKEISHHFLMGVSFSIQPVNPDAIDSEGHWAADWKTGYRWCTDAITSGPDVQKLPGATPGSEMWGPYPKLYTRSLFGQLLFTPPESVDGVPILCRCRDIPIYMRDGQGRLLLGSQGAMILGGKPPACWEDNASFWNPYGDKEFTVTVRHPGFYIFFLSKNLIGDVVRLAARGSNRRKTRKRRRSAA